MDFDGKVLAGKYGVERKLGVGALGRGAGGLGMTTVRRSAKGCAELAARAAVVALGLLAGGCTALLGVTDVTEAVDASDGGGGSGVTLEASAADATMAQVGDAGTDSTTTPSADAARDSTSGGGEATVGLADGEAGLAAAPEAGDDAKAVDAGGCLPTELLCNGGCVPNDAHHCGTCGNDCTALAHVGATVACVSGVCSFSCASGWAHCADAGAGAGCETDVSTSASCGACGHACSSATPLCSGSGGAFTCVSGCPAGTPTLCSGNSCIDTTSNAGHCGSCTKACSTADPHAQPACANSACTVTCNAGYSLCPPGACVDEQTDKANCGACGTACSAAAPVCLKGLCAACTPMATRCSGAVPQTCDASGAWQSGAVTAGQCGAVCTPGKTQCALNPSNSVQTCGASGQWDGAVTSCGRFACSMASCKTTCASHAECSSGNFCWDNACVTVAEIAAGFAHTCALTTAGTVQCWGENSSGQLGNSSTTSSLAPVHVSGLSGVSAIAAHDNYTCALTTGGGVQCWGHNVAGQLGDNSTINRPAPVSVTGLTSGVAAISPGGLHACALMTGGGVQCWGSNSVGQLGNNSTTDSLVPSPVSGLSGLSGVTVTAVSAGGSHSCALTTGGGVQCWGFNGVGMLGDNSTTNRLAPVAVSSSPGFPLSGALSAGSYHTCALTTGGGVQCWGDDSTGQLGDNSMTAKLAPVSVSSSPGVPLSGVTALSAGSYHTCALTTGGGVQCWGDNLYGQLGDNSTTNRLAPVSVFGLSTGVAAISAGTYHTCALTTAGLVQCWGYNVSGQLGDSSTTDRPVPVQVVEP